MLRLLNFSTNIARRVVRTLKLQREVVKPMTFAELNEQRVRTSGGPSDRQRCGCPTCRRERLPAES